MDIRDLAHEVNSLTWSPKVASKAHLTFAAANDHSQVPCPVLKLKCSPNVLRVATRFGSVHALE